MPDHPRVSVIIPVFNAAPWLDKTLTSVLSQTLGGLEVVCVDDGSTDGSAARLDKWARRDARVVVLRQSNAGAAAARNRALEVVRGRFVAFMDADDLYPSPDVLERLCDAAERNGAKLCGGGLILREPSGHDKKAFAEDEQWMRGFPSAGFVEVRDYPYDCGFTRFVYARELFADGTVRFPTYRLYEDPPFFVRALVAAGRLYGVDFPTYVYCARPRTGRRAAFANAENARDYLRGLTDVLSLAAANGLTALQMRTWAFCSSAPFRTSLDKWPFADAATFRQLCRLAAVGPESVAPLPLLEEMRLAAIRCSGLCGAVKYGLVCTLRRLKRDVGRHVPDAVKFWRLRER